MGVWSLYFLAKLALYYERVIGLHLWLNLAFAAALAWPIQASRARQLRTALAIPAGLALFYLDARLPSWQRLLEQMAALGNFRAGYLWELAQRVLVPAWIAAALALVLAYVLLAHRVRFATFVFAGLAIAAIVPPPAPPAPPPDASRYVRAGDPVPESAAPELSGPQLNGELAAFYGSEHGKRVSFARAGIPRFDLILLSVCSLSDDDLDLVHLRDAPFLDRFDIVFRHFNSAATYSGPAVLRLLHGSCGQTPQSELYAGTAADDCYLFRNLAAAGYRPALLLNHDGHFDDFAGQLRMQGGLGVDPLDNRSAPVAMSAFDGSPVRADFELLQHWWLARENERGDGRYRALLYNTISLHDGNRVPGLAGSSRDTYAPRLRRLFSDLGRFIDLVEASGHPTVLVLIPEHGAALRGDAFQVAGLRELPTRAITTVPAAVKLIGFAPDLRGAAPIVVDRASSYLDLTTLIAGLMQGGPAGTTAASLRQLLAALPPTAWVAENAGTLLLHEGGRDYLRAPSGEWSIFDAGGATPPIAQETPR
jgi:cellulose synthase operon protein YhjU